MEKTKEELLLIALDNAEIVKTRDVQRVYDDLSCERDRNENYRKQVEEIAEALFPGENNRFRYSKEILAQIESLKKTSTAYSRVLGLLFPDENKDMINFEYVRLAILQLKARISGEKFQEYKIGLYNTGHENGRISGLKDAKKEIKKHFPSWNSYKRKDILRHLTKLINIEIGKANAGKS